MKIEKWLTKNCQNIQGKTIVITGATGGIGKHLLNDFAFLQAKIIFTTRKQTEGTKVCTELKNKYPNLSISFLELDLCDINSVNEFIFQLKDTKIDYLIHNAGIYNVPRKTTNLNHDNIFQVNCLMPYYITKKLAKNLQTGKVIYMGSIAHNYSKIDTNDIEFMSKNKSNLVYGNSKRYGMFAFLRLMQEAKINLSITHPGITLTKMTNHYPKGINWLVKIGLKLLFPTPQKASLHVCYALSHSTTPTQWIGPKFFNLWGKPTIKELSFDKTEQAFAYNQLEKFVNEIDK